MKSNSAVDNKLGSNNRLLTTKYNSTASSSICEQDQSASSFGKPSKDSTVSGVMSSNLVTESSQFFSDSSDDSSDEDIIDYVIRTISKPSRNLIYAPTLPTPHLLLHIKMNSLIAKLKADPGVPIVYVASNRKRASSNKDDGQGKMKKSQNKEEPIKEKSLLYSSTTPLVDVLSFKYKTNKN